MTPSLSGMLPWCLLTTEEQKRYRLAWNLARYDFICGTGRVRNKSSVVHYRNICNEILVAARKRA